MKRKLTFALLAVFLAASALVLHSAEKKEMKRVKNIEIRRMHGGGEDMMPGALARLFEVADDLELTNPQLLQLRMLYQKQSELAKKRRESRKHDKELSDPDLKEEDVKKFAAEQAKMLEAGIIARFQMQQEFKKIFTPEQLKKLEESKAKHRKNGPPMGGRMGAMPFGAARMPPMPFGGPPPFVGPDADTECEVIVNEVDEFEVGE